ncbi:MAG: hypothetical protein ACKO7V_04790, partial [Bacteroidota bacterium]
MAAMPRVWEHPEHSAGRWRTMLACPIAPLDSSDHPSSPPPEPHDGPAVSQKLTLELGCGTGLWTV